MVGKGELWKMKRDFQFEFMKKKGLKPHHKFLDLGCGTLRGGVPFISYLNKGNFHGIDVRREVFPEAEREILKEGLQDRSPNLFHFDRLDELNLDVKFDMILAFSVLFHMEEDILRNCFGFVKEHLKEDGRFYANVNIGEPSKFSNWREFPVHYRPMEFYRSLAKENGLIAKEQGTLRELGHISGDKPSDDQVMLEIKKGDQDRSSFSPEL